MATPSWRVCRGVEFWYNLDMEYPPQELNTPEDWGNEVHLTKVRDKLLQIKNEDEMRFKSALAAVAETNEFLTYGAQLELFILRGGDVALAFADILGVDYDLLASTEFVSVEELRK